MRDLDSRDVLSGDFLVVSGDVVSNIDLESALAKHRTRREKDKNAIMTMILHQAGLHHDPKRQCKKPTFVIDPKADRCLHYDEVGGKSASRYLTLDPDFLTSNAEIEVRQDLIDPHIDICTADVLAQWSENFDYQNLRQGFLFGVLKDHELNGKTIHTHVVQDRYAARVGSLREYDTISKDVVDRWAYPLCPDSNLLDDQTYHLQYGKIYQEERPRLGRGSKLQRRCVIGKGTDTGERSVISNSILGRNCQIGNDVHIEEAYVWDDVIIEDHVNINGPAVIGKGVKVCAGATIEPGAKIASGTTFDSGVEKGNSEKFTTNADSAGHIDYDSDASSSASLELIYQKASASISQSSISTFAPSDTDFDLPETSRRSSFRSDPSEETIQNRDFQVEATASILDGLTNGDSPDTIFLELNSYRLSVDASQHEVRQAVVTAMMRRIAALGEATGSPREAVRQVFTSYKSLVERIILDKAADEKRDQADFLLLVQRDAVSKTNGGQLLLFVTKESYDLDIIEEDGVLQWWEDVRSGQGEMGRIRELVEQFIRFLREAEEDEGSEEDEDEDEEEDEESG